MQILNSSVVLGKRQDAAESCGHTQSRAVARTQVVLSVFLTILLVRCQESRTADAPTAQPDSGSDAQTLFDRGLRRLQNDAYELAIADFTQAIRIDPEHADAFLGRGIAYRRKGEYDSAITDLDQALRLRPDDADALSARGQAYLGKEVYDSAIADFDEAIAMRPYDENLYVFRGVAHLANGATGPAMADFDKAIALSPDEAHLYFARARVHLEEGDIELAMNDLNRTVQLAPNIANPYYTRAGVYLDNGDYDSAIADYERFLDLSADADMRQEVERALLTIRSIAADVPATDREREAALLAWFETKSISVRSVKLNEDVCSVTYICPNPEDLDWGSVVAYDVFVIAYGWMTVALRPISEVRAVPVTPSGDLLEGYFVCLSSDIAKYSEGDLSIEEFVNTWNAVRH